MKAMLPGASARRETVSRRGTTLGDLPEDFFEKVAGYAVNDPQIGYRIDDDRTCPLIWGEAGSARFLFLQMCIRDRHSTCREIWTDQLHETERKDFISVYDFGPPSADFFENIMVNHERIHKDLGRESSDRSDDSWLSLDWLDKN